VEVSSFRDLRCPAQVGHFPLWRHLDGPMPLRRHKYGNSPSMIMRLLSALFLLLALAVPTLAREEIRAFESDVTLRTDGSVVVIETIDVRAEGDQIRRGIYRDIPVTMQGPSGKIRIDLDVQSVTRAGRPEPFRVERMGDFQRIWIGDP